MPRFTKGGLINQNTSTTTGYPGTGKGVWRIADAQQLTSSSSWPSYGRIPDAPAITGVARVSGSGTSIDVTFTAPAYNGNQTITSYTAVSSPSISLTTTGTSTPLTITGTYATSQA